MGSSMYHHGFAMLALAESTASWTTANCGTNGKARGPSGGARTAVRQAITSQKRNSLGGWRYLPRRRTPTRR